MHPEIAEASEDVLRQLLCYPEARDFLLNLYCQACIGQLVPGTAHQLRNPLNAILNSAQLMEERGRDDEGIGAKLLPVMLRSSQRMGDILDAIDTNLEEHTPCDLRRVVETSLRLLRADTMGIEIKSDMAAALLVQGQMHTLQAMVLSLLQRHLACRPRGIDLRLSSSGELVELRIQNVQVAAPLQDRGLAVLLQESLANSLGGSLTCSTTNASSTLLLPAESS